jgi:S1-C subfamily serine protease
MNTAIISSTNDFSGIGFAIPSDTISREVMSLIEDGEYEHPWLGISGYNMSPELAEAMGLDNSTKGTLVATVVEGGPAESAGLEGSTTTATISGFPFEIGGDVIIGINGLTMDSFYKLQVYLTRNTQPGDTVTFSIIRDGDVMQIDFTLGVRPPPA